MQNQKTEILIPALNEEQGIGHTITEIAQTLTNPHFLVIDGHSHDRTIEVAKNLGAQILLQDGQGKGDAIAKAIQHIHPQTEYIVLTDADYTYPAQHLPEMIQILQENPKVGMVCGNRFTNQIEENAQPQSFYFGNKLLAFAHKLLNGVALNDPLTGLRVIRADLLRCWTVKSKGFDIEVELNRQIEKSGYTTVEVPIKYRKRLGEKKLKMKHGISILKRIMLETI